MTARYRIEVASKLLAGAGADLVMPAGLRIAGISEPVPGYAYQTVTVVDDGAPEELEGKLVRPVFRQAGDGTLTIVSREACS